MIFIGIAGIIGILITLLWRKFKPAKLKVKEITCWHIFRDGSPANSGLTGHEYNFEGEISIIPRTKAFVEEFYLNLPMNKGNLRVDILHPPPTIDNLGVLTPSGLSEIKPDNKIVDIFSFKIRIPNEIKVPSHGSVIMEFNRGKARQGVHIRLDDEYRPKPLMSRGVVK